MIFQDPISSLNPRRRVIDIVSEPLTIWKIGTKEERRETANAMLDQVGIDPFVNGSRRPREFSGRPVPAHQHRPGPGAQAQAARLRRDRLRPRRVGAGADPEPAAGPEAGVQPDHPLHRARPGRGQERERPGGRHVPRAPLRDRTLRPALRGAGPPLHGGPARLRRGARPRGAAHAGRADRGAPEPDQPAVGLPLPHPLPTGRGPLRRGGPRNAGASRPATRWPATSPSAVERRRPGGAGVGPGLAAAASAPGSPTCTTTGPSCAPPWTTPASTP